MKPFRLRKAYVQIRYCPWIAEHWTDHFVCTKNGSGEHGPRHSLADYKGRIERIDDQTAPGSPSVMVRWGQAWSKISPASHPPVSRVAKLLSHPEHERTQSLRLHRRFRTFDRPPPRPMREVEQLGQHHRVMDEPLRDDLAIAIPIAVAEKVVALVAAHVRECPDQSLMVVTFNAPQRDLILDTLREAERDDEVLRQYREAWERQETPLVVRNLVNVQGDERDRVIISTTFGPPPEGGRPKQNFGDIGRAEGARRINVLVTRAKLRVDAVTSMDPDDIEPSERSQAGVYRFQEYLRYARGERWWAEEGAILERDFDSPFEEAVYESLRRKGYAVEKQVGVSTYRVDLAVRHPEKPGHFLLGIECDGATYHSSREARDRDRLREAHLQRLGWNLHRVWSTDWFRWPDREMERLERAINSRLVEAGIMPAVST